jgi:hypothetical protein
MRKFIVGVAVALGLGALTAQPAEATWNVATYQGTSGAINTINDAETLINTAPILATSSPTIINYSGTNFPGSPTDYFALKATGYVDVVGGTSKTLKFYINSDDGFRLRLNGVVIGEYTSPTSSSNYTTASVTVRDGDLLTLTYFEQAGVQNLIFQDTLCHFIGNSDSGVLISSSPITSIPEPAAASMPLVALLTAAAAMRWQKRT